MPGLSAGLRHALGCRLGSMRLCNDFQLHHKLARIVTQHYVEEITLLGYGVQQVICII
jgi:hypothetical protein